MRRMICLALLVVLGGVIAGAASATTADEGTLSIKRGKGDFTLAMHGAAIGRLGDGILIVEISVTRSCDDLKVWGGDDEDPVVVMIDDEPSKVCAFSGPNIRFRLSNRISFNIFDARRFFLSAAGRGDLFIDGKGGADGVYSINDREPRSLPNTGRWFEIAPATAALRAPAALAAS